MRLDLIIDDLRERKRDFTSKPAQARVYVQQKTTQTIPVAVTEARHIDPSPDGSRHLRLHQAGTFSKSCTSIHACVYLYSTRLYNIKALWKQISTNSYNEATFTS